MKQLLWLLAGIIIGVLLVNSVCNKPVPITDTAAIDSLHRQHVQDSLKYADSLAVERLARIESDSARKAIEQRFEGIEAKMKNQIVSLTFKLSKYRTSVSAKDTIGIVINCAEVVQELDSTYQLALAYKAAGDSLRANGDVRRALDSAALALRDNVIDQLNKQYNSAMTLLKESVAANAELRAELTKSKRGKWLLAAIAFVGGGFLGHQIK